jgi:hypothetical protein
MRKLSTLLCLCAIAANVEAADITSAYTQIDPKNCRLIEAPDEYVFEGAVLCKGYGGIDIYQSGADARSYAAFGEDAAKHCAAKKTFNPFNTALSPIEWRLADGVAFAAIERWSISDSEGNRAGTWLVVTALRDGQSCHVHYVSGSYPNANEQARRAADDLARGFDCENDVPTSDSKIGAPPIAMIACRELSDD